MKSASTTLQTHLASGQTTLAYLWKVKRTDGTIFGFTNHDEDIDFDAGDGDGSVTYAAATGLANTASANKSDLSVDNLEVTAFFSSAAITAADIRAGRYDDADIKVFVVNWADLTMGAMIIRRGTLGVVKMINGQYTAELRGLAYKLTTVLGASCGPICRAEFGSGLNGIDVDSKYLCMVDVTAYRQTGSLQAFFNTPTQLNPEPGLLMVGSSTPTDTAPDGWFDDGVITFTSGANDGLSFEIKTWKTGFLTLFLPLPYPVEAGDTFTIEPGCNKTAGDCTNKYNNIVNFRGEPFIPGMDRFMDGVGVGLGRG